METLTNSSLKTFRECPRKYSFKYEQRYESTMKSEALYFGTVWHAGLEAWGKSRDLDEAIEAINDALFDKTAYDEYLESKVIALIEGYHERYKDEPYAIIAREKPFVAPVLNPETARESKLFQQEGIIDALLSDRKGRIFLKESKTTSDDISPESDYWRRLLMDSQVSTYYLGAEANGFQIDGCLYDVVKKPTIRPKQVGKEIDPVDPKRIETPQEFYERLRADIAERPDFYYARKEIPRSRFDLEEHLFDVWHTGQSIQTYRKVNKWPRNTSSCMTITSKCEFFEVCSGQCALEDTTLFRKKEKVHSELANIEREKVESR